MEGNGEVPGKKRKQSRSPRRRSRGHRTHAHPYELRQLREENAKRKRLVTDLSLDRHILQELVAKRG